MDLETLDLREQDASSQNHFLSSFEAATIRVWTSVSLSQLVTTVRQHGAWPRSVLRPVWCEQGQDSHTFLPAGPEIGPGDLEDPRATKMTERQHLCLKELRQQGVSTLGQVSPTLVNQYRQLVTEEVHRHGCSLHPTAEREADPSSGTVVRAIGGGFRESSRGRMHCPEDRLTSQARDSLLALEKVWLPFVHAFFSHRQEKTESVDGADAGTRTFNASQQEGNASCPAQPISWRRTQMQVLYSLASPGSEDQFFHQDNRRRGLTVLVPLVDVPSELGPTQFLLGTHRLTQGKGAFWEVISTESPARCVDSPHTGSPMSVAPGWTRQPRTPPRQRRKVLEIQQRICSWIILVKDPKKLTSKQR